MRKTISTALATAAVVLAVPAVAQEGMPPQDDSLETAPDAGTVPGLTPDQQSAYDAWPTETQDYYLTLSPDRQELFWQLSDQDKVALSRLAPEQQDAAWAALEEQVMAAPPPAGPLTEPSDPGTGVDPLDDGSMGETPPAEPMG